MGTIVNSEGLKTQTTRKRLLSLPGTMGTAGTGNYVTLAPWMRRLHTPDTGKVAPACTGGSKYRLIRLLKKSEMAFFNQDSATALTEKVNFSCAFAEAH